MQEVSGTASAYTLYSPASLKPAFKNGSAILHLELLRSTFKPLAMKTVNLLAGCGERVSMQSASDKEAYKLIGQRMRIRRTLLGIDQKRLAEMAGISLYKLKRYEAGESTIPASTLIDIAKILRIPFGYFFNKLEMNRSLK